MINEDGNLLFDGRWRYTWDGESRLAAMETDGMVALLPNAPPRMRMEFAYDGNSRRIAKVVRRWRAGPEQWVTIASWKYLYEGWNMLAETDELRSGALERAFVWGLDISGSMQGAGGVGGLLGIYDDRSGKAYNVMTEVNGNVMGLVDAASGQSVVRFDYDAFGNRITAMGSMVKLCPYGFSTKYTDTETGLCYYGYRHYDPMRGRWLCRDPIGERGGVNLYGMVGNDAVNRWDYLGLRNPTAIEQAVLNGLDRAASSVTDSELKKGIPKVKEEIERKIRALPDGDAGGNDLKAVVGGLRRLFSPSDAEKNAYRDWTVRMRENSSATKYQCSRFVRAVVQEVTGKQFKSQPEAASFVNASSSQFGRDTGINMPIAASPGFGTITAGGTKGRTGQNAAHVVLDLGNGLVVGHHPTQIPDEYRGEVEINGVTFTYDITIRKASRMTENPTAYPNIVPRSLP